MDKKVIHTVFENTVEKYPLKIAIETEDRAVTYRDVNTLANRLAHLLESIGCKEGNIINVVIPSSAQLVYTMLSVFKSGCIYLPVDLSFSEKRLKQLFTDTFDGIIITTVDVLDSVIKLADFLSVKIKHLIVIGDKDEINLYQIKNNKMSVVSFAETPEWQLNLILKIDGTSNNYIFYTSGSTGEGKAIVGSHGSLSHFIHWEIKEFNINESYRISQLAQITFDASLRDIFVALIAGGTLCIPSVSTKTNPEKLLNWIEESSVNLVHSVPSVFRLLLKEIEIGNKKWEFNSLKYIFLAGELLYAKDILSWRNAVNSDIKLINLYGATETTLIKTFYRIEDVSENPAQIIPVGKPISNTSIAIINDNHLCKEGEIGEIYIKTPFATKGYYKNEKLTNEYFIQNPLITDIKDIVYRTGDLGRFLPTGDIEVLGRFDSQVKVNGVRIELGEIEQAMLSHEKIKNAIVKTHRGEDNFVSLIAYYTGEKVDVDQLRNTLGKILNQQLLPSYFVHLNEFPLNINGKIDKKALPLPGEIITSDINFTAPEGTFEILLAELWKEVLGLEKIGRTVSFFNVGGQSLRAFQLLARIDRKFGVNLKIEDIFTHHTLRDLADFISKSLKNEYHPIQEIEIQENYPLSYSQSRLLVLAKFDDANIAYNMPGVYQLEGDLSREALEYAFLTVIERHESLRTIFDENKHGEVRQFIHPVDIKNFRILYQDLQQENEKSKKLESLIHSNLTQPFDLSVSPLIRASLFRIEENKWMFTYVMHHIISDGWSMEILIKELLIIYNSYVKKQPVNLAPLRIHYKDYVIWEQQRLQSETAKSDKEYWLDRFKGNMPVLKIPSNKLRPAVKTYNGGLVTKSLTAKLSQAIKAFCQNQDTTLFMNLLAGVKALLYKYSHQNDIIVGSPIANRNHIDLEDQIGFYVNTLALRTRFNGTGSFEDLLAGVKQTTLEAYAHQTYPFDELVNVLNHKRDTSRSALFDVMVVLQNTKMDISLDQIGSGKLKVTEYEHRYHVTSKFDLLFNFVEIDNEIELKLEYNSDIYEEPAIEQLANHFEQLMETLIKNPKVSLNQTDYLSISEKNKIVLEFNNTYCDYDKNKTVIDLFEEQVEKTPNKVALIFEGKQFTYDEINNKSNQLARNIKTVNDPKKGECIGVLLDRSEWSVISMISIMKLGCIYVPIDKALPASRISYIIKSSGANVLVIDNIESIESLEGISDLNLIDLSKPLKKLKNSNLKVKISGNDSSFIIYTSGSTGAPKGVEQTHLTLYNLVLWDINGAGLLTDKKHLQFSSFSFDSSLHDAYYTFSTGGELHVVNEVVRKDLWNLKNYILENKIEVLSMPYAALKNMFNEIALEEFNGHSIKEVISTGEQLYITSGLRAFLKNNPSIKIHNFYGPSETHVVTASVYSFSNGEMPEKASIGKPIHNTSIYIYDEEMKLVPIGVEGQIYIGGWNLAKGYFGNPDLTAERFIADPLKAGELIYRSGDIGKWQADGEIEYITRIDNQIKINGYRIELEEIEMALRCNEQIQEAVVMAKELSHGDTELVAYVVSEAELNASNIRKHLNTTLPKYMLPSYFMKLDTLPLNANGKVDKKQLQNIEGQWIKTGVEYVAPSNEVETKLIEIWKEILGSTHSIGVKDNFFELGGNSLKALKLFTRIKKQFEVKINIKDIFLDSTVEALSLKINAVNCLKQPEYVENDNANIEKLTF